MEYGTGNETEMELVMKEHTILARRVSISALIVSCSLSYAALSGLPEPYSMSVISGAGVVVVVVVVAVVVAARAVLVVDFDFWICESLVEAVLVLVGADMKEDIKDEEAVGDGGPLYTGTLNVRGCDVEGHEG